MQKNCFVHLELMIQCKWNFLFSFINVKYILFYTKTLKLFFSKLHFLKRWTQLYANYSIDLNEILVIFYPYNYVILKRQNFIFDQTYSKNQFQGEGKKKKKNSSIRRLPFCLRLSYINFFCSKTSLFNIFSNTFFIIIKKSIR